MGVKAFHIRAAAFALHLRAEGTVALTTTGNADEDASWFDYATRRGAGDLCDGLRFEEQTTSEDRDRRATVFVDTSIDEDLHGWDRRLNGRLGDDRPYRCVPDLYGFGAQSVYDGWFEWATHFALTLGAGKYDGENMINVTEPSTPARKFEPDASLRTWAAAAAAMTLVLRDLPDRFPAKTTDPDTVALALSGLGKLHTNRSRPTGLSPHALAHGALTLAEALRHGERGQRSRLEPVTDPSRTLQALQAIGLAQGTDRQMLATTWLDGATVEDLAVIAALSRPAESVAC